MAIIYCNKTTVGCEEGRRASRTGVWFLLLSALLVLSACYPAPYRGVSRYEPDVPPESPRVLLSQLYFYPKVGQTNEQQSRDHYECYNWAMSQTGFDPGQSSIPTDQRVRVVPMPPPGHDTATLAIAGAVLGALIGGPRHAVGGALIGASGGAIAGAASDSRHPTRSKGQRLPTGDVRLYGRKRIQRALKVNLNRKCAIHIPFFRRQ
jgi:hypothetical protein